MRGVSLEQPFPHAITLESTIALFQPPHYSTLAVDCSISRCSTQTCALLPWNQLGTRQTKIVCSYLVIYKSSTPKILGKLLADASEKIRFFI